MKDEEPKLIGFTWKEFLESQKALEGKTLEDLFSPEELAKLREKYYINFNCGILSLGAKDIHISKRETKE